MKQLASIFFVLVTLACMAQDDVNGLRALTFEGAMGDDSDHVDLLVKPQGVLPGCDRGYHVAAEEAGAPFSCSLLLFPGVNNIESRGQKNDVTTPVTWVGLHPADIDVDVCWVTGRFAYHPYGLPEQYYPAPDVEVWAGPGDKRFSAIGVGTMQKTLHVSAEDLKAGLQNIRVAAYQYNFQGVLLGPGSVDVTVSIRYDGTCILTRKTSVVPGGTVWDVATVVVHDTNTVGGYQVSVDEDGLGLRDMYEAQGDDVHINGTPAVMTARNDLTVSDFKALGAHGGADDIFLQVGESIQLQAKGRFNNIPDNQEDRSFIGDSFFEVENVSGDASYTLDTLGVLTVTSPGHLCIGCRAGTSKKLNVYIPKIEIAMDGNRDDVIDFEDPVDSKYLFWVNNDYDLKHYDEDMWHEDDDSSSSHHDCEDNHIGNSEASGEDACKRDLEDFTRLQIKVDDTTANLPGITYFLQFENVTVDSPSINVFEAVKTTTEYLSKPAVAADQILKHSLTPDGVGSSEVQIDAKYIKAGDEVSSFIIEGRSKGMGNLTLIVKNDNVVIAKQAVTLELHDIPWFCDAYSVGVTSGNSWDVQVPSVATHVQTALYAPKTDEKFLLVHGWNMTDAEKTNWTETVFKRLWWQGYQGAVALFNWPTLSGFGDFWDPVINTHHFDNSEFRSWLSSDALVGVFNMLNVGGNKLRVMAHSMGNVVTGEAIRRYAGASLHTYLACQAAVSAQYYDHAVANSYACQQQQFDPAFPSTPDIMGHFSSGDVASGPYMVVNSSHVGNMQNYFNQDDWALARWEINNVLKPDGVGILFGYLGSEDHYIEGMDQFSRGPIGAPYEILSVEDQRQLHTIFTYCDESRSRALGQTANGQFANWNLKTAPNASGTGGMGYDNQHYSHSREFRSNIADEWEFWKRVYATCEFERP